MPPPGRAPAPARAAAHAASPERLVKALWILFTFFIVYGTMIPFDFRVGWSGAMDKIAHLPFNPLISPDTGRRESVLDLAQNVLLFVPFGALGILALSARTRSVIVVTGLAMALSTTVESVQLFTVDRVASFGDVVFDTIGAFLGALVAARGRSVVRLALLRIGEVAVEGLYPAIVAGLVLCASAWRPFDVTLDVSTVMSKIHALQHDPWQFRGVVTDEAVTLIQYSWFAFAVSAWLHRVWASHQKAADPALLPTATLAAAIGVLAAFSLEASQAFIASARTPGLEDALVRATGAALGALLWALGRPQKVRWAWFTVLVAVTAVSGGILTLSPFEAAPVYQPLAWLPTAWIDATTVLPAVDRTIGTGLIYLPLGFWLTRVRQRRSRTLAAAAVISVLIALPLECAMGWVQGSDPNLADVGFAAAGGWLGAYLGLRPIGGSAVIGRAE